MASVSKLVCIIYLVLILHNDDEVAITEEANVNIGRLICNSGAGGPALGGDAAPVGGPAPSTTAEEKVEAKRI
ncbi:large ribosomal subunit protein P1-like [Aotus nancymaae]|uniref:large ribosomal subunit protein P1-like n=1 Tax=Aotus nancymaae TaxID=37293 RepID=UPI000B5019BA|nr:60S acidic ribosomal protein P1-like [Aotus nancymaae]